MVSTRSRRRTSLTNDWRLRRVRSKAIGVKVRLPSAWPVAKVTKVVTGDSPIHHTAAAASRPATIGAASPTDATKCSIQPSEPSGRRESANLRKSHAASTASVMLMAVNGSAIAHPSPHQPVTSVLATAHGMIELIH